MLILRKQQHSIHLAMGLLKVLLWAKARDKSKYNNSFRIQIMYIVADDKTNIYNQSKKNFA